MKKEKEEKINNKEKRKFDRGQIFVRIMAAILSIIMIMSIAVSLIYALIQKIKNKIWNKEGVIWKKVQEIIG